MLDVMYEIPSKGNIVKCIVTKDSILGKEKPRLIEGEGDGDGEKKKVEDSSVNAS